jgi:hypothetical protein
VYLELYQQLAGRRDTWLSEVERLFAAASAVADEQEKKRRKDDRQERERLLLERQAEAERLAETEQRRAGEQSAAAKRYRRIAAIAAFVTAFALMFAGVAQTYARG